MLMPSTLLYTLPLAFALNTVSVMKAPHKTSIIDIILKIMTSFTTLDILTAFWKHLASLLYIDGDV